MTDASSSVADTLTGAEIRNHKFSNAFRGLDPEEVRRFLSRLADVQDNLREAVKVALQERDELAEQVAGAADEGAQSEVTPVESTEDPVALAIREDASSTASATLSAARNEANAIVAKANDEAARIVLRARAESRGRALEGSQSDPVFGDVPNDPDAAKEQARMMIQEARAVRERILTDLAKRRKTAHIQLEQLRVAREKLLESLREARRVVDEASRDLSTAEVEARIAAEAAGRRVAAEPLPSSADLAAEIAGISNVYGIRRSIEASNSAEAKASEVEEIALEVEREAATVEEPAAVDAVVEEPVVEEPVVDAVVEEAVVEGAVVEAVGVEAADGEPIVEEDLEPAAEVAEIARVENDAVLGEPVSESEHNVVEPQHLVVEPEHVVLEPEHAVAQVESEPVLTEFVEPEVVEPEVVEPEPAETSSAVEMAVPSQSEIGAEEVVAQDVHSEEVHYAAEPQSVVEESEVEESVVDGPVVVETGIGEPDGEDVVVEAVHELEARADEPTTDEPTADEPTTEAPDPADQPVPVDDSTTELPVPADEPTTDQPTTDEPTTELPVPADELDSFEAVPTDEPSLNEPVAPLAVAEPVAATPTSDSGATDKPKRRVGVDDLFARLRAEREQAAANARVVLDDAARSARETNESAAAARKAKADAGAGRSEPMMDETFVLSSQLGNQASEQPASAPEDAAGSFDDLANDDSFLESTDDEGSFGEATDDVDLEAQESYVTGQLQSQLVRSAKRHLGDEQSSALAVFRTSRGRADLLMLLGDEPQQLASLQATLSPFFEDAFRVGSHQAAMPDEEVQAAVESFVAETVHDIVGRIRSEIGKAAEATASPESDASLLNDAISNAYRSWTTDEVAGVANGRLVASWRVGQAYRANRC